MLFIMPLILWTALSQAAFSGSFVPLMYSTMDASHSAWSSDEKLSMSLFAMIPLGAAEIIGGLVQGQIFDKYGHRAGLYLVMVTGLVAFVVVLATIGVYDFSALTFFMTFAWGLQDACLCNFANCILAFEFESKVTPFSVFKFSQSLFTFGFLVLASIIDDQVKFFIYFGSMAVIAALALTSMLFF